MGKLSDYFPPAELGQQILPLINGGPDYPDGDMTGWSVISGGMINVGGFRFEGGPVAGEQRSNQDVALIHGLIDIAAVDSGNTVVTVSWEQSSWSTSDQGWIGIEFLDAVDAVIPYMQIEGEHLAVAATNYDTWWPRSIGAIAPVGARKVRIAIYNERFAGTNTNGGLRNIVLKAIKVSD